MFEQFLKLLGILFAASKFVLGTIAIYLFMANNSWPMFFCGLILYFTAILEAIHNV